jgi:hypothetical protein
MNGVALCGRLGSTKPPHEIRQQDEPLKVPRDDEQNPGDKIWDETAWSDNTVSLIQGQENEACQVSEQIARRERQIEHEVGEGDICVVDIALHERENKNEQTNCEPN